MNLEQLMDGKSELYLPLVDDGVKLEKREHDGLRVRMGKGESVAADMSNEAEDVLWRLMKANADKILSWLATRIVEARSHELKNRSDDDMKNPITLADIGFGLEELLPWLPISLCVNDHAEQCDCGIGIDVGLAWSGRLAHRSGGLRWMEACMTDELRDVLRELLNSCAPMMLDAMINRIVEDKRKGRASPSPKRDNDRNRPTAKGTKAVPAGAASVIVPDPVTAKNDREKRQT